MSYISKNIKKYRLKNKIKQGELAKAIGKTPSVVANWESGLNRPDVDSVMKMCQIFGVDTNELLGWYNIETQQNKNRIKDLENDFLKNGFKLDISLNDFTGIEEVRIIDADSFQIYDSIELKYFCRYYEPILIYTKKLKNYKTNKNKNLSLSDRDMINKYHSLDEYSKSIISATIEQFESLNISKSLNNQPTTKQSKPSNIIDKKNSINDISKGNNEMLNENDHVETYRIASRNGVNELKLTTEQVKQLEKDIGNVKDDDFSDLI